LQLCAVADKDGSRVHKFAGQLGCEGYDDYRQLIIQNQLDCLLVAAPIHSCLEYLKAAIKKGFNLFKLAPPARDFDEAAELGRLAKQHEVIYAVANPRRFCPSFTAAQAALHQGLLDEIFLITGFCSVADPLVAPWQGDPKLAGGGVLLYHCYELLELILRDLPIPEQVYALMTNRAQDKQQRRYLTEDTAIVTLRFSDTLVANLTASYPASDESLGVCLRLYGRDKILEVTDARMTIRQVRGQLLQQVSHDQDHAACLVANLKSFADNVLSPQRQQYCGIGRESLKTMAVISSAYLSARTQMPEEPGRILQMAQLEPTDLEASQDATDDGSG